MILEYSNPRELLLHQDQQFIEKKVTLDPSTMAFNTSETAVENNELDLPKTLNNLTHS